MSLNIAALAKASSEARGLAMDAVQKAASGHLGLPLGATELGNHFSLSFPLFFRHSFSVPLNAHPIP